MIVEPFPQPPAAIVEALYRVASLRQASEEEIDAAGGLDAFPRPWDPTTCDPELRQLLWLWCDDVAGWINSQYAWRPQQLIPECWPSHAHIARELPGLACQRFEAAAELTPVALEEWHRQTLPQFLARLADRIGDTNCRTGKHIDWPAASRQQSFQKDADQRRAVFAEDTGARNLRAL